MNRMVVALFVSASVSMAQSSFIDLGEWTANGLSPDGEWVVGFNASGPCGWNADIGYFDLPLPPGVSWGQATAVSDGGSVIVGGAFIASQGASFTLKWDADRNVEVFIPGNGQAISADGMTIVSDKGFWRGHYREFPEITGGGHTGRGVSNDGRCVVGSRIWLPHIIADIRINNSFSPPFAIEILDVTDDWQTFVGWIEPSQQPSTERYAFRSSASTGTQILNGTTVHSTATAVSADGAVIVGDTSPTGAFVWTEPHGALNLREVLACSFGLEPLCFLADAVGVSRNGQVIAGNGENHGSETTHAWWARIDGPVEAPGECEGTVNLDDLLYVLGRFGGPPGEMGEGDVDGDGDVDLDDLLTVLGAVCV